MVEIDVLKVVLVWDLGDVVKDLVLFFINYVMIYVILINYLIFVYFS